MGSIWIVNYVLVLPNIQPMRFALKEKTAVALKEKTAV